VLHVLCVFGTRPDAIKMAPVVLELRRHPEQFHVRTLATGQHREQLDQVLNTFGLRPDRDLGIMEHGQTLARITVRAMEGMDAVLEAERPDVVIAQGDTTTTFVAALAAFYRRVPFAHVEAGLRTFNAWDPFPEEMNRRLAGAIARLHFAPTEEARANLLREGIEDARIRVTGNTGIDALLWVAARDVPIEDTVLARLLASARRLVTITAHRRENLGAPLERICRAVRALAETHPEVDWVYAMHKNPAVRETVTAILSRLPNVHLIEPPAYAAFVKLLQRSALILTDSGGIQEEAPSLGVPVVVLRETTERPEGIAAGVAWLVGTAVDAIVSKASDLLIATSGRGAPGPANPYGDGRASERIRDALAAEGALL